MGEIEAPGLPAPTVDSAGVRSPAATELVLPGVAVVGPRSVEAPEGTFEADEPVGDVPDGGTGKVVLSAVETPGEPEAGAPPIERDETLGPWPEAAFPLEPCGDATSVPCAEPAAGLVPGAVAAAAAPVAPVGFAVGFEVEAPGLPEGFCTSATGGWIARREFDGPAVPAPVAPFAAPAVPERAAVVAGFAAVLPFCVEVLAPPPWPA